MFGCRYLVGSVFALAWLVCTPAQLASAQPYDETEARNLQTVRTGFDAWANGTGSPYEALADEATWEIVGKSVASRVYTSKEDFMANVIRPFNARMSTPLRPVIRDIYADGDTVIVLFDAEGTARDGVRYRNTYSWFLTLVDNRIVKGTAFFDSIAFNDLWQRVPA
jgi:ketosteroid isomerase-like protein